MSPIGQEELFLALFFVAMLMAALSVPRLLVTVRASSKEIGRYRELRGIKDLNGLPASAAARQEWERARSPIGYGTLLLGEIERLNDLRPVAIQAQTSALLMALIAVVPGFEAAVLAFAVALIVAVLAASVYASRLSERFVREYMEMLKELEPENDNGLGSIYG